MKIELDHMVPRSEGGSDVIENAIPLCFECHAEVHAYNPAHPRGRRFRPEELRIHKEQWLRLCENQPHLLVAAARDADVGPLQALVDEFEFNEMLSRAYENDGYKAGAPFVDRQFHRAMAAGALSVLDPELKEAIFVTYAVIARVNKALLHAAHDDNRSSDIIANLEGRKAMDSSHLD